jgi:hypothetical protein
MADISDLFRPQREALADRPAQCHQRRRPDCALVHAARSFLQSPGGVTTENRVRTLTNCDAGPEGLSVLQRRTMAVSLAKPMAEPFVLRERWFDVSMAEFEAFLRDYPRLLEARPPLHQTTNYREWVDPCWAIGPGTPWRSLASRRVPRLSDPTRLELNCRSSLWSNASHPFIN